MKQSDIVLSILGERLGLKPQHATAEAYAPSNIALCKYWGKRDQELNLPITSSLSISLADQGARIKLSVIDGPHDEVVVNGQHLDWVSSFGKRLLAFFDLFRSYHSLHLRADIQTNIPIGAGLASSACGYASVVKALDALFGWKLANRELSILARLGSGSASRSLEHGFVEWYAGIRTDGMDSYGELIADQWPELCIGLMIFSAAEKSISSRDAMQRTMTSSPLYAGWPTKVASDLSIIKQAINLKDFALLGKTTESNALTMHATMLSAWPPILYALSETVHAMQKIWQLRQAGLSLFFTQDAGPNLKLLFLERDREEIQSHFPNLHIVKPFCLNTEPRP